MKPLTDDQLLTQLATIMISDRPHTAAMVGGAGTNQNRQAIAVNTARIATLGGILDARDQHKQHEDEETWQYRLLPAALWYAQEGVPVFPLQPGSKVPLPGSHGCLDATTNPDQIRAWWQVTPQANIGVACGAMFDVVDLDGPQGVDTWAWHTRRDTRPPLLGWTFTPRGQHLYVPPTGAPNGTNIAPGVDYRGHGGYVLAPPSHVTAGRPSVKQTGSYRWVQPLELSLRAVA